MKTNINYATGLRLGLTKYAERDKIDIKKDCGSITPRTYGRRQLEATICISQSRLNTLEKEAEQILPKLQRITVQDVDLSITSSMKVFTDLVQYRELSKKLDGVKSIFTLEYQKNIRSRDLENVRDQNLKLDSETPLVTRYCINNKELGALNGTSLTKKELHVIEATLFRKAFEQLKKQTSARECIEQFDVMFQKNAPTQKECYPNNVVLVDVFVRDENDTIAYKDNTPETHAVVLWKKSDGEIILIDPNNGKKLSI